MNPCWVGGLGGGEGNKLIEPDRTDVFCISVTIQRRYKLYTQYQLTSLRQLSSLPCNLHLCTVVHVYMSVGPARIQPGTCLSLSLSLSICTNRYTHTHTHILTDSRTYITMFWYKHIISSLQAGIVATFHHGQFILSVM